ncbi:unnamed protein product, partial [Ilex paraguariensis]
FPDFSLDDKDRLHRDGNDANVGRELKNAYNRVRRMKMREEKRCGSIKESAAHTR